MLDISPCDELIHRARLKSNPALRLAPGKRQLVARKNGNPRSEHARRRKKYPPEGEYLCAAFAAIAQKLAGRFMIRNRTRVVQRHPVGDW